MLLDARDWLSSPAGRRVARYFLASVVSVLVGQATLLLVYGVLQLWSAATSNVVACLAGAVASYRLNRSWVWGRSGRSHLLHEVLPFGLIAVAGLGLSTLLVAVAEHWAADRAYSHAVTSAFVSIASLLAIGILWLGKFALLGRVIFAVRPDDQSLAE